MSDGRSIVITDQGSIVFREHHDQGSNQVKVRGPRTIGPTDDYVLQLPDEKAVSGQFVSATTATFEGEEVTTLSFASHTEVGMAGLNVLATGSVSGNDEDDDNSTVGIASAINTGEISSASSAQDDDDLWTSGNERVIFPAGVYQIQELGSTTAGGGVGCFEAPNSYWLEGAGMGLTVLRNPSDNTSEAMIEHILPDGSDNQSRIFVIRNMTIDGRGISPEDTWMVNLRADYIFIDNVEFINMGGALNFLGDPKVIGVTNCRFIDMDISTEKTTIVNAADLDGTVCDFIFKDNLVRGYEPVLAGDGQGGVNVSTTGSAKQCRCTIRGNHFENLGNGDVGSVKVTHGHNSNIDGNLFTSIMGTAISASSSSRLRINGNRIANIHGTKLKTADTLYGINVDSDDADTYSVDISHNEVNISGGATDIEVGINVDGDTVDTPTRLIRDVKIVHNVVNGGGISAKVDNVYGDVDISGNVFRSWGNIGPSFAALLVGNIQGDAKINIADNRFVGGAASGRAIWLDRSASGFDLPSVAPFFNISVVLTNNYVKAGIADSEPVWGDAIPDMALIYINGHSGRDLLRDFHASGNRYDFTDSNTGTYGLFVDNITRNCTFDSVLEFGAIGDGDLDCTMAFNRAGLAAGTGGDIYIPAGTYNLSNWITRETESTTATPTGTDSCIKVTAPDQVWHGEGILNQPHIEGAAELIMIHGETHRMEVRGLTFKDTATDDTKCHTSIKTSSQGGDRIIGCTMTKPKTAVDIVGTKITVDNCKITDPQSVAVKVDWTSATPCYDVMVTCNHITSAVAGGLDAGIGGRMANTTIRGNVIRNCGGSGISLLAESAQTVISANEISGCAENSIKLGGTTDDPVKNVTITGNNIVKAAGVYTGGKEDIVVHGTLDSVISNNTISSGESKIHIDGIASPSKNVTITGNVLDINNAEAQAVIAVDVKSASQCIVSSNIIRCSDSKSTLAAIDINISADCIVGENIIENFLTGINVTAGSDNCQLGNNRILFPSTDAGDAQVADAGEATQVFFSTVPSTFGSDVLKIGTGGFIKTPGDDLGDIVELLVYDDGEGGEEPEETIDVTSSFHFVRAEAAGANNPLLKTITIGGLATRKTVSESQALASGAYDGMILILSLSTGTANDGSPINNGFTLELGAGFGAAWPNSGENIIGNDIGGNGTHRMGVHENTGHGQIVILRFQHNGEQGVWQIIGGNPLDWIATYTANI